MKHVPQHILFFEGTLIAILTNILSGTLIAIKYLFEIFEIVCGVVCSTAAPLHILYGSDNLSISRQKSSKDISVVCASLLRTASR